MPVVPRRLPSFHRALLAGLLGASLTGIGAARAQSLQELYQAARAYDATYLAARALADSAPYRIAQTEALLRPNLALTGSAARVQTEPAVGSNYGSNSTTLGLQGKQPLFNKPNSASVEQARRSLDQSIADLDAAEQDLIVRVSQAYFDVLAAQDTLDTTRASKAAISEQLASAKRNFEVGTATITDTREAQARFDLATAQEIAADNDLLTKRIALDQLVGRAGVQPRQLATPVALPVVAPLNVEDWVSGSQQQHPTVRRAQVALDIATLETDKAKAGHLPTLDAVASFSGAHGTSSAGLGGTITGTNKSASVGVQLNLPLFAGYSIQNRVKETLVLEDKARNDLDAARRGVAQTTRQAFAAVVSGQAQVRALEAAESSSQLALEATQLGYRVGVRVNLDVLNAQTQLFTTRRDLSKARYDVLVGGLKLRQAAGQLRPEDVAALNQLLVP